MPATPLQFPPPYDGADTDTAPDAMPPTRAPVVENFLVDRPGALPMRGPINEASTSLGLGGTGKKPVAVWNFNDKLLIGARAVSATAIRDPWVAPYRKAAASTDLAAGDTALKHLDLIAGTLTPVTATNADTVPGPRFTRLGAHVYGIAYDAVAAAVNENGGFKKLTKLLRSDGTAVQPTAYTNAPQGAQDVRAHYQRLFALGGRDPAGTGIIAQNTLWWSDPIAGTTPLPDTLAAWQDDVSGLTNQIIVDSDDASDFGVALAKLGQNLAIFKRRSIHMLLGYSSKTWAVRTFTVEQGCIDPRSVVEYENGVFFMSDQGFMFFDGSQLVNTTQYMRSSVLASAVAAVGDRGVDGGRATAGRLPNGYIALSIGTSDSKASSSASTTSFCGLYHVGRRAWVTLKSDALVGSYPIQLGRATTRTFLIDDDKVIQANKLTAPEQAAAADRGVDSTDVLFTWDSSTAFTGTLNTLKNGAGIEAFPSGQNQFSIKAIFTTRLLRLASPLQHAQLHRFVLDYNFQRPGQVDESQDLESGSGWFVKLVDGAGVTLVDEYQVPIQGDPTSYPYRRRHVKDVFSTENIELQVTVQWRGTAVSVEKADIQLLTASVHAGPAN